MSASVPSAASGPLLLADISGYTSFLQNVASAERMQHEREAMDTTRDTGSRTV